MTTPAYEARAAEELGEYNTFRAVAEIYVDGLVAYRVGHAVPVSNVRAHGYDRDGLVERVDGEPLTPLPPAPSAPVPVDSEPVQVIDGPVD